MMTPSRLILAAALLVIAANTGVWFYVIETQKTDIARLQKQIAGTRQSSIADPVMKDQEQKQLDETLQQMYASLLPAAAFTEYAVGLRDLIQQNRLAMDNSLVFLPADTQVIGLQQYNTRMRVHGPYPQIKRLISDVMNQPGLTHFNAMRFETDKDNPAAVRADLDLSIFFSQGGRHDVE